MDLNFPVTYRTFLLNDPAVTPDPNSGIGHGIAGCVIDSVDFSDTDVIQFIEKRSLQDGMDAGDPFLGMLHLRMAGTLYGVLRETFFDAVWSLRKALSPTLAARESPADHGYLPLYFSVPTNRIVDYPSGKIDLQIKVMPKSKQLVFQRDNQGGENSDSLAIPWQATFVAKDPSITATAPQDTVFPDTVIVTGVTATASSDLVNKTAHGLITDDRIYFTTLTGGAGLVLGTPYYVLASGLTANAFKVSLTSGGAAINITTDATVAAYVKVVTFTGNFTNRGTYHSPLNLLVAVGAQAGVITVQAGGVIMTITVPSSTGTRVLIYDGQEKTLSVIENAAEAFLMNNVTYNVQNSYPAIVEGVSAYSVTFTGIVTDPGAVGGSHMWFWEKYA